MRFLHTSDWHLGRSIRGRSRIDESARVLDDVVRIARDESVDAVLIAGDTFDAFGPPTEAQKLLFETLSRFVSEGRQVVLLAGNHDSAPRMDALSALLAHAGIHCIGTPVRDSTYRPVRLASKSGEAATIVAIPWINDRFVLDYERVLGTVPDAHQQYAARMETALNFYARYFDPATINVFAGHMFVDKAKPGGGERAMQMGDLFAVLGSSLPATAQYIALGHVHKDQPVPGSPVAGASFYCGSLLQLDFGEAEQAKSVRVIDIAGPGLPADSRAFPVSGGIVLRDIHTTLEGLPSLAGTHADDYLRVYIELGEHVPSLPQQVRDVLPNAIDVIALRTDVAMAPSDARRRGLEPHELVARYYQETHNTSMSDDLLKLFRGLHEEVLIAAD
jgi:exonuclease SbcD